MAQGSRHFPQLAEESRRARKLRSVVHAAVVCVVVTGLLGSLARPAAASHVVLCTFGFQCVRKTHDGPIWALSRDEPYIVEYDVLLNRMEFPSGFTLRTGFSGVDSGESRIWSSAFCIWDARWVDAFGGPVHGPEDIIHLVAVMEHDQSDFDVFNSLMIHRMRGAVITLREAGLDRTTMVSRLIEEFDRTLRQSAVDSTWAGDPDDLIARPQEVRLNRLDFDFAGGGAHLIKRVHHVGADGHYVTLHRLRPR